MDGGLIALDAKGTASGFFGSNLEKSAQPGFEVLSAKIVSRATFVDGVDFCIRGQVPPAYQVRLFCDWYLSANIRAVDERV